MPGAEGHDSGQAGEAPAGYSWSRYVESFTELHGGWTALADELLLRARRVVEMPDLQSVEKGLRRLSVREHRPGGQYGRWMLRFFGLPRSARSWARWLGQYHSRFSDLPVSLQREQLNLWNRPPISESSAAAWLLVGAAACAKRAGDDPAMRDNLARAGALAKSAGTAAILETTLFTALVASGDGNSDEVARGLDAAQAELAAPDLDGDDRAAYGARVADQRAYQCLHPRGDPTNDVETALALYEGIDEASELPFVAFRRNHGIAYCRWRMGQTELARAAGERAMDAAGDGGLVRFRIMSMNLLARIVSEPEGGRLRARADAMARRLEDEDLLARLHRPDPPST